MSSIDVMRSRGYVLDGSTSARTAGLQLARRAIQETAPAVAALVSGLGSMEKNSQEAESAAISTSTGSEPAALDEAIAATSATPSQAAAVGDSKDDHRDEAPISARRAKAMSIGNAASLFGAPGDDGSGAALFGSISDASSASKPSFMAQSSFDAIGEESEEPIQPGNTTASSGAPKTAKSPVAESPNDTAAALFGDGGQSPVEWLGGAVGTSANTFASNNDDASNLFATSQQQQIQDPSLYASGQFGDAQYAYDYSNQAAAGNYGFQQDQQQYPQQPQAFGQYDEPAVDNFNQNMYYDPAQQQQYQQSLQAQAHLQQQTPAYTNGHASAGHQQQQYAQYENQYAASADQDQYAAYYAQQPQSQAGSQYAAQQTTSAYDQAQYPYGVPQQQQGASAYQSQDYLQAQQGQQAPYSAPAAKAQTSQFTQPQTQGSKTHYAPAYSQAYDPYAPSSDPYASQAGYSHPSTSTSSGHMKQPSLTASNTTPNLAAALQTTTQQPGKKDPKLNRSASSFFAELPPMPAKARPSSAIGARAAASVAPPVPPLPYGHTHQQAMPPPPQKTRSPALGVAQQRPPSRTTSAQPSADYGGWSPSTSGPSHSRPGSRTAQRQGSLASTSSHPGHAGTSRSSIDQTSQYAQSPYGPNVNQQSSAYGQPMYGGYSQQTVSSPPMAARQSVESNRSQYGQQFDQSSPYTQPSQINGQSQSRPQSRTGSATYTSPPPSQSAVLPPAKRATSRPMAARTASSSSSVRAMSPKQQAGSFAAIQPTSRTSNKLGLTEDDGMEELMDSFNRQRLDGEHKSSAGIASEDSFNSARKTPLPASEPDTEPRILSPPQSTLRDLQRMSASPADNQAALSPPPASVPTLSVSLASPEVDKKPTLPLSEDASTESDLPSEMQEVDEELTRAEQEVKMEEEDMDQKPSHRDLHGLQGWHSKTSASTYTYGTSPYEGQSARHALESPFSDTTNPDMHESEETKPSDTDLRQAWQTEAAEHRYGQHPLPATGEDGWPNVSVPYQPDHSSQQQQVSTVQYGENDTYDAYGQDYGQSSTYEQNYGQQSQPLAASGDGNYGYAAYEDKASSGFEQPLSAYEPYQPSAMADTSMYPSHATTSSTGQARRLNRPAVPIASFGFNGKLVTFFPNSNLSATASYGMMYDQASSSATIKIRKLAEFVPSDASGVEAFPGPLFMDSGATSASGKAKKKKELLAWLNARIEDSQKERSYLGATSSEEMRAQADQKTVVLQLIKILLDHDGKLTGTPQIDQLVQQALVPHLSSIEQPSNTFAVAAELGKQVQEHSTRPLSQATSGDLDTIQMHLLRGEKKEAVQYALNNRLYTHALVIASGTDKSLLAEVVKDFLAFELGGEDASGREPLRVAYSLFAGSGPACINEFVPVSRSQPNGHAAQHTPSGLLNDYGPVVSRAPSPTGRIEYPADVPAHTLSKWQDTAAMIIANRAIGDSQALTSLGDVLAANHWYRAAHACYLLSPLTSTLGGPSVPGVRWTLLGANDPLQDPIAANNLDAILLTEIVEFAFSLLPVPKGQEAYIGLPHLQAYRVIHACYLADAGYHSKAQKYCDAIGATLKLATKRSPFYHPTLLAQVKDLSDRLSMVSFQDKGGSWISRKVQRPTIDNVWSTLESRFAKFVTGDGEEDPAEEERKRKARDAAKGVAGPFAHYSSITPQGPEGLSRNGSYADLTMRATPPPQPTSVPNTVSHAPTTKATHHRRSSSYTYGPYGADPYGNYVPQMPQTAEEPEQPSQEESQAPQAQDAGYGEPQYGYVTPQNDSGWWSTGNGGQETSPYGSTSSYGQAPTFSPVTEGFGSADAQGLMSPMGFSQSPNMTSQNFQPQPSKLQQEVSAPDLMDDDDDLGLGNNSARRRKEKDATPANGSAGEGQAEADKKAEAAKKEEASKAAPASGSGSWLGRIFRREGSASPTTGPIRAKLGEETSFVYDPVEKRWVNKKAGSDTPPPAATPPPPRAQTASPAGYSQPSAPAKSGTPPPPSARSASATPMNPPPPARSTPPPPSGDSASAPAPPPGPSSLGSRPPSRAASVPTGELPPPPARKPGAGGAAAKKARSRYVDVFAQEQK